MPLAVSRLEVLQVRKLIQCVRQKDNQQIAKMAELGIEMLLDYQDPDTGESALHVAVSLNHEDVVLQLLELGASVKTQDKEGLTPVMVACQYGHVQSLEQLGTRGITADIYDKEGKPSLFHCLYETSRHAKCLDFLLRSGVDPNTLDQKGTPILCAASVGGHERLLERLLEGGADPNARDVASRDKPALVLAAEKGHHECVKLLMVGGADGNATFGDKTMCALHCAGSEGHFEVIQVLSAYGADFTKAAFTGENAMHFATLNHRLLCLRMLAQRGCPANEATHESGATPQKLAKAEGHKDSMKELKKLTAFQDKVARGAKPKGYAEPWAVQLYDWLIVNKVAVKEMLCSYDPDKTGTIETEDFFSSLSGMGMPLTEEGRTKLLAVYDKKGEGKMNYNDLLADHKYIHASYKLGPKDDIKKKAKKGKKGKKGGKGKKGKTKIAFPIYYEQERPMTAGVPEGVIERQLFTTDIQRFDRDAALPHAFVDDSPWYLPQPETQYMLLYEAVRHGNMESFISAMASGLSVNCRDKYNKTPLMVASSHGRVDMVKFLLEREADVNAYDNFQWTALHHASHAGEEAVVKLLLDHGCNIDAQAVNGGTPIMRAIETSQRNVVKMLIARGANINLENKHGHTALEVARNWGDDFIYAMVYAKAATLPPPPEKKGKEKGGKKADAKAGKGKGKKGKKGSKDDSLPKILPGPPLEPLPPPPRLPTPAEYLDTARRRSSLGSMQATTLIKPSPTYRPKPAWVSRPPSTLSYLDMQNKAREEQGIESTDFGELRSPFQLQILARVQALEVSDT